jgi:hypothetical protein
MTDQPQKGGQAPDPLQSDNGRPEPTTETAGHPQPPPATMDDGMRTGRP